MALSVSDISKVAAEERDRMLMVAKWADAYRGAEPQEALLVEAKLTYFIVEFRQGDRTTGLMLIDSETGEVGAITGIQEPGDSMFHFVRPNEVPTLLARYGREIESGDVGKLVPEDRRPDHPGDINPANVRVQTVLFWEPCDQSLTPFQPFYRAEHMGPGWTDHFFVRVDGEIFTKITHGGAGM